MPQFIYNFIFDYISIIVHFIIIRSIRNCIVISQTDWDIVLYAQLAGKSIWFTLSLSNNITVYSPVMLHAFGYSLYFKLIGLGLYMEETDQMKCRASRYILFTGMKAHSQLCITIGRSFYTSTYIVGVYIELHAWNRSLTVWHIAKQGPTVVYF